MAKSDAVRNGVSDNVLAVKWSGKRVVRSEVDRFEDPGVSFVGDPGRTDQSQAKDCDVNVIVDRYAKTGVLPGTHIESVFADVSNAMDYQECLNVVLRAEQQFNSLDAYVRARFANDPAQFLAFVENPNNASELVKLGLGTLRAQDPTDRIVEAVNASNKESKAKGKDSPSRQPASRSSGSGEDA